MRSSSSQVASNLIRALAIRFHVKEAAKLAGEHISGKFNKMADVASRDHVTNLTDFLTFFTSTFTPKKGHSWTLCQLKQGIYSRLISELLEERLLLASWKRLPEKGAVFWRLGNSTCPIELQKLTRASLIEQTRKKYNCWLPLPTMCDMEAFLEHHNQFAPKQSKWLSGPSPRQTNWMDNKTPWLHRKERMFKRSNSFLLDTGN